MIEMASTMHAQRVLSLSDNVDFSWCVGLQNDFAAMKNKKYIVKTFNQGVAEI